MTDTEIAEKLARIRREMAEKKTVFVRCWCCGRLTKTKTLRWLGDVCGRSGCLAPRRES